MGWKITDKFLVDPQDNDSVPFDQGGIVRRSTWGKIKDYILGNASLVTNDKTVRGAINEVNTSLSDSENKIAQLSNPNLLINGDFQVWQRGTSFNQTATGSLYCADRWQFVKTGNAANFLVNKVAGGVKVTNTSSDGVATYMVQTIEVPEYLQGKKVTLSYEGDLLTSKIYFNSVVKSGIGGQDLGSSDVNSSTKTITATIPIGTKALSVMLYSTANYFTINRVKLESGSVATPFVPRTYAEELALCKRYYEKGPGQLVSAFGTGYLCGILFTVEKRVIPTSVITYITDLVTWANVAYSSVINNVYSIAEIDGSGYTTNRLYRIGPWIADSEIY